MAKDLSAAGAVPFRDADPRLHTVFAYWNDKRGARAMPARADIEPAELKSVLPYLMLTDVVDGGARFRYRLCGTAVAEAFGQELTGQYVDEVMTGRYREFIEGLYRDIVARQRPVYSTSRYGGRRQAQMWTQRLMLPLSSDGVNVDIVLSIQVFLHGSPLKTLTVRLAQDRDEPIDNLSAKLG
ncbi:MAG TPA: PAS domain-containing protein [Alphaproteobacteria bacterium]